MRSKIDICMIVHNDVTHDSRVQKEASSLAKHGWNVLVIGIMLGQYADIPTEETINSYHIKRVRPPFRAVGTFPKIFQLIVALPLVLFQLRKANARSYHGHDFVGLLILALAGIWNRPIIYDSHELFFEQEFPLPKFFLDLGKKSEQFLAKRTNRIITVNEGIATELARKFNTNKPIIIRNTVDYRPLLLDQPCRDYPIDASFIIVHSGNITFDRHLIELVSALQYLPLHVGLVLMGSGSLESKIRQVAQGLNLSERIRFISPVDVHCVVPTLSQADLGVALMASDVLNNVYSLPNKFFESIAAGLPVLTSPNPELKRLVEHYDIGLTCDPTDPKAIAEAIQTILEPENYARFKANVEIARKELTWENEEKKLIALYKNILATKQQRERSE